MIKYTLHELIKTIVMVLGVVYMVTGDIQWTCLMWLIFIAVTVSDIHDDLKKSLDKEKGE